MAVKLSCLCLLLLLVCLSRAQQQTCPKSASTCEECIQSGPECAWCTNPNADTRCHTAKGLRKAGCSRNDVYNPRGRLLIIRNEPGTLPKHVGSLFIRPQEIFLHLRPGVSQSFALTVITPSDHLPITNLTMDTSNLPPGVSITFSRKTDRNPLLLQVSVEFEQCLSNSSSQNMTGPWSVHITPRGYSVSLKLDITLKCQCCNGRREEDSPACSGHGALICGKCECYEPYIGKHCQVHSDSYFSENEDSCRSGQNAPVCSGRGDCVGGFCECAQRANPAERYSGRFCECSNFDCPNYNNRLCGGNGKCVCGKCICDNDWIGDDCSCSMETASCMAKNQMLCSGRGMCQCGVCVCEAPYAGPTCEDCPTCQNNCMQDAACVECRAFGTGPKRNRCETGCGHLTVTVVETIDDMPRGETDRLCKIMSSHDSCFFFYTITNVLYGQQATVARTKQCPRQQK